MARDDAEKQICDKLKQKLDEFIELESYDWLLVEPQGHASTFVSDLIAFLNSTFTSFTNLPVSHNFFFPSYPRIKFSTFLPNKSIILFDL